MQSVGMGNEEERNTRSFGKISEGAKTTVRADSEVTEELEGKVGMHQGLEPSPFLLAVVVNVVPDWPERVR